MENIHICSPLKGADGKTVATIKVDLHDRKFSYRIVDPNRHILNSHGSICYDDAAVVEAQAQNVEYHVIKWKDTGETQYISATELETFGQTINLAGKLQRSIGLGYFTDGSAPPLLCSGPEAEDSGLDDCSEQMVDVR